MVETNAGICWKKHSQSLVLSTQLNPTLYTVGCGILISSVGFLGGVVFGDRSRFVASQRGDYHARYSKFRLWLTEKVIYNTADVLLTNSEPIQRYLCQRYPDKNIHSIPNLLELPTQVWAQRKPTPETEEKLIVSVGRFAPEKGHRYLIEALNLLKQQNVAWRCTFLGEGKLETELRALVAEYGLSEQVAFPGFCEDVFSVLLTADVFVLPSLHEGSPNALIEAMGIGMPCIASDVGGIADLIESEENGYSDSTAESCILGNSTASHID